MQDALLRLAGPIVARRKLLHPLPGGERALAVLNVALADDRDLFEAREQLLGRRAGRARVIK